MALGERDRVTATMGDGIFMGEKACLSCESVSSSCSSSKQQKQGSSWWFIRGEGGPGGRWGSFMDEINSGYTFFFLCGGWAVEALACMGIAAAVHCCDIGVALGKTPPAFFYASGYSAERHVPFLFSGNYCCIVPCVFRAIDDITGTEVVAVQHRWRRQSGGIGTMCCLGSYRYLFW